MYGEDDGVVELVCKVNEFFNFKEQFSVSEFESVEDVLDALYDAGFESGLNARSL